MLWELRSGVNPSPIPLLWQWQRSRYGDTRAHPTQMLLDICGGIPLRFTEWFRASAWSSLGVALPVVR